MLARNLSPEIVSIALSSREKLLDSANMVAKKIILEKGVSSFVGIWVGVFSTWKFCIVTIIYQTDKTGPTSPVTSVGNNKSCSYLVIERLLFSWKTGRRRGHL